ncbi:MAG: ABC transporter ATP-binding protein [Chloroflexota bacterium]
MVHLKLEHITKRFGNLTALNDLSLEVYDQEFMVLLGPTGAGKTTTLRCAAGLEKPNEGDIFLDGKQVNAVSPTERDMAFVFQNYALYPRKTVYGNIAFPLEARKFTKAEMDEVIGDVTTMLRINHLLDRLPAQLSGGEQQRVALARAMVRQPSVFAMDEPLTNLDFKLRAQMRSELKRIQQDLAATFFYVTNDQLEALSLGDRIAVLNEGVLQQVGPPQMVYENPVNLFVARFIGSTRMNLLHCHFDTNGQNLVGQDNVWQISCREEQQNQIKANNNVDQLIFGIRPEDIALSQTDQANLSGEVYVSEQLGDRIIYDIKIGQEIVKIKASPDTHLKMGEQVSLLANLERAHLFDQITTEAIR